MDGGVFEDEGIAGGAAVQVFEPGEGQVVGAGIDIVADVDRPDCIGIQAVEDVVVIGAAVQQVDVGKRAADRPCLDAVEAVGGAGARQRDGAPGAVTGVGECIVPGLAVDAAGQRAGIVKGEGIEAVAAEQVVGNVVVNVESVVSRAAVQFLEVAEVERVDADILRIEVEVPVGVGVAPGQPVAFGQGRLKRERVVAGQQRRLRVVLIIGLPADFQVILRRRRRQGTGSVGGLLKDRKHRTEDRGTQEDEPNRKGQDRHPFRFAGA